jgi:hypothetical protein
MAASGNNNTRDYISQQLLYPLNDPTTAFRTAMVKSGISPYMGNPFVTQLEKAAQGARIAFLAHGGPAGDKFANPSEDYGKYLQNAISGGSLFDDLTRTASNFGTITDAMKRYGKQLTDGSVSAVTDSPYYSALHDIFSSDDGMGALGAYAQLRSPLMGGIAPSFTRGLQSAGQSAMMNFAQQGGFQDSPWDWLFPKGQGKGAF